jgi:invasion protein IalB
MLERLPLTEWNPGMSHYRVLAATVLAAISCGSSAVASDDGSSAFIAHSSWMKICDPGPTKASKRTCYTKAEAWNRLDSSLVASVAIFDFENDTRKILRVTFPLGTRIDYGTRLVVDDVVQQASFLICSVDGCVSDHVIDNEAFNKIMSGKTLLVQAIDKSSTPMTVTWPLDAFAAVYDGPPSEKASLEAEKRRALLLHNDPLRPGLRPPM